MRFSLFRALSLSLAVTATSILSAGDSSTEMTHKQLKTLKPLQGGSAAILNTFTLDNDGNILACVSGAENSVQKYSPDGKLLNETKLSFTATAIKSGSGRFNFCRRHRQSGTARQRWRAACRSRCSTIWGIPEKMREEAEKSAKAAKEEILGFYKEQQKTFEKAIKAIEEKEEPTKRDKARLKALKTQQEMFNVDLSQFDEMFNVDAMMAQMSTITSLAVTSKDVFLCCSTGNGYDVWRMDHDFSSPKKVVEGLSGCCGQCDIQANDDFLVLAENSKFQVSLLDREGERVTSFGSRDRSAEDGFGSCCNPMNVRCCGNGDILTAESSIGYIKRFNKDGELQGVVGKAKIGGGCKHVAIGFDEKRDRYYMQHQDKNEICILVPKSEAPEFTEDELIAKAAMEGLGKTLIGKWSVDGKPPGKKKNGGRTLADLAEEEGGAVFIGGGDDAETYFHFEANGKLELRGGFSENAENSWEAVSQDEENKTFVFAHLEEGIQYYNFSVKVHRRQYRGIQQDVWRFTDVDSDL